MTQSPRSPFLIVPVLAVLGMAGAGPAHAQAFGRPSTKPIVPAAPPKAPRALPPPALPGAQSQPDTVAPPTHLSGDMSPTDALFDAINRGDIASARDALNRGADLRATNVLGLTPIELSVDLGRRDISFLLLSLRGTAPSGPPRAPTQAVKASPPPTRAQLLAEKRREQTERRAERAAAARSVRAPRFAADNGTPQPAAGFLGF